MGIEIVGTEVVIPIHNAIIRLIASLPFKMSLGFYWKPKAQNSYGLIAQDCDMVMQATMNWRKMLIGPRFSIVPVKW